MRQSLKYLFTLLIIVSFALLPFFSRILVAEAGSPAAPPGTIATFTSFTNNTPVTIPTGPAVVSSTLNVSVTDTYLLDIDLTTFVMHTFPGDIDMTLQSPAGTIVTLTTDNAGTNDNVFNGTVWDDDANPGGQVPYVTNNGIVTDHTYAVNVLASPLTPEEPLAAFIGEDPNGTWTLTISDDAAGDGGALNSWTLDITTLNTPPITTVTTIASTNVPVTIPTNISTVSSTLTVSGVDSYLLDVDLTTFIAHTYSGDIDMTLRSPSGTIVTLSTDNGGEYDNVFNGTVWNDDANPAGQVPYVTNNGIVTDHAYVNNVLAASLSPEEPLGAFIGEDPNGTWTLTISDDANQDGGTLNNWSLTLTTVNTPLPAYDSVPAPASTINIGTSNIGVAISTPLVVSEVGNAALDVSFVSLTGTNAADFSVLGTFPFTIADGGASVALGLQCTPSVEGLLTATLTLGSNDPALTTITYNLECTGSASASPVPTTPPTSPGSPSVSDPAISKIGILSPGQLGLPGEQITWLITVNNFSGSTLSNVVVSDTLVSQLRIDSVTTTLGTVSTSGQTVTVNIGNLNHGQQVEIRIVTTVLSNPNAPYFENTAQLSVNGAATFSASALVPAVSGLPDTGYPQE